MMKEDDISILVRALVKYVNAYINFINSKDRDNRINILISNGMTLGLCSFLKNNKVKNYKYYISKIFDIEDPGQYVFPVLHELHVFNNNDVNATVGSRCYKIVCYFRELYSNGDLSRKQENIVSDVIRRYELTCNSIYISEKPKIV